MDVIHILLTAALAAAGITIIALIWHRRTHFPIGLNEALEIKRKLENVELRQSDLTERFTRFQNRDSMRSARDAKSMGDDLTAQAAAILGEGGPDNPPDEAGDRSPPAPSQYSPKRVALARRLGRSG